MDLNHHNNQHPADDSSSLNLLGMSIISFVVYSVLAFLIFRYGHYTPLTVAFEHGFSIGNQLLVGISGGVGAAAIIAFIAHRQPVSEVLNDFYIFEMIVKMRLSNFDRTQVSVFAGVGEELLFRGAIQPLLGNALTSIIFVGIHGYFKFKSKGHILFGITMFGLSMMLGFLFSYAGLIAAMAAHAIYDIIMLKLVQKGNI